MSCYIQTALGLIIFFICIIFYNKYYRQKFIKTIVNNSSENSNNSVLSNNFKKDIHELDSRYSYPFSPPINPKSKHIIHDYRPENKTELLQIPLQSNDPYNEPLRTQDILITDYNKIKYGNK